MSEGKRTTAERLLAAELEVARLREAIQQWGNHRHGCSFVRSGGECSCGFRKALEAILDTSPPDLGPLRELVAAWKEARLQEVIMPARLADALDAVLARYSHLGERP